MNIRKARVSDAEIISRLTLETLEKINTADYTSEQIEAWKTSDTPKKVQERIEDSSRYVCVAIDEDEIIGVGSIKEDEIVAVYIKVDCIRKGIGSSILLHLEQRALKEGIRELELSSSLTAVKFYEKHGYTKIKDGFSMAGDVQLPSVIMQKQLKQK